LTEQQAAKQGLSFEIYTKTFSPLKATMAAQAGSNYGNNHGGGGDVSRQAEKGLVKLLVESGSGRLLGLHMVGEDAPEIMQVSQNALSAVVVLRVEGVCISQFIIQRVGLWRLPRGSS
jgi:glutathione reductase (NADPH)